MAALPTTETIAAIATAPGYGGIGIIRISGPQALPILRQCFLPRKANCSFASHRLYYGTVIAPDGQPLDEALAVYMAAPQTYTREDVVEIHSHGSPLILQEILRGLFERGVRPAENGEFTKRAFLAGRIDLTRAEAVLELLQARSRRAANLALHHLQGELHGQLEDLRQALIDLLAQVEVAIDFPDDDEEILDTGQMLARLREGVISPLTGLLERADQASLIREGVVMALAGRPNVGKSSLLNALLQEERALVTPLAGTTRDTIEEDMLIDGIPVRIIDTAGIREHQDAVEALGIERAWHKMAEADLVLLLLDGTEGLRDADLALLERLRGQTCLLVINKKDLLGTESLRNLREQLEPLDTAGVIAISAKKREGLEELRREIGRITLQDRLACAEDLRCAPNTRHQPVLRRCLDAAYNIEQALINGTAVDLLAVDLQSALGDLGEITGATSPDEVLDAVFSRFCLGK